MRALHPANAVTVAAMDRDGSANRGNSLFARFFAEFLRAMHESRRLQGEREIARYRHLIGESDDRRMTLTPGDWNVVSREAYSDDHAAAVRDRPRWWRVLAGAGTRDAGVGCDTARSPG
jgi:hypothetical protein